MWSPHKTEKNIHLIVALINVKKRGKFLILGLMYSVLLCCEIPESRGTVNNHHFSTIAHYDSVIVVLCFFLSEKGG